MAHLGISVPQVGHHFGMLHLLNDKELDNHIITIGTQGIVKHNQKITLVNILILSDCLIKNSKKGGPLRVFYGMFIFIYMYIYTYIYTYIYIYIYT